MKIFSKKNLKFGENLRGSLYALLSFSTTLVFLLLLAGCSYTEGIAVDKYLKKVAEVQFNSDSALLDLNEDIQNLGGDKAQDAITRLESERDSIKQAQEDIQNLGTPETAEPLKGHLLDLYGQGADLIDSLIAEGKYHSGMAPLTNEYEAAAQSFSQMLKDANTNEEIAASIKTYAASSASIAERAARLKPSVLSSRTHEHFIANLATLKNGLNDLSAAIEAGDQSKIEAASAKLNEISANNQALADQLKKDRQADAKDYNSQITKMSELMGQIKQDEMDLHEKYDKN